MYVGIVHHATNIIPDRSAYTSKYVCRCGEGGCGRRKRALSVRPSCVLVIILFRVGILLTIFSIGIEISKRCFVSVHMGVILFSTGGDLSAEIWTSRTQHINTFEFDYSIILVANTFYSHPRTNNYKRVKYIGVPLYMIVLLISRLVRLGSLRANCRSVFLSSSFHLASRCRVTPLHRAMSPRRGCRSVTRGRLSRYI